MILCTNSGAMVNCDALNSHAVAILRVLKDEAPELQIQTENGLIALKDLDLANVVDVTARFGAVKP